MTSRQTRRFARSATFSVRPCQDSGPTRADVLAAIERYNRIAAELGIRGPDGLPIEPGEG